MSESLRNTRGFRWIRKGQELPRNTITHAFTRNSQRILRAERDADASDLQDWFASDFRLQIEEGVRSLGCYGKILTVLNPSLSCAVERRFSVAGANPAQHLSLRLVAALAYYGGNEMI